MRDSNRGLQPSRASLRDRPFPLALPECTLHFHTLPDISDQTKERLLPAERDWNRHHLGRNHSTVPGHEVNLGWIAAFLASREHPNPFDHEWDGFGMDELHDRMAHERIPISDESFRREAVHEKELLWRVDNDCFGRRFDQRAVVSSRRPAGHPSANIPTPHARLRNGLCVWLDAFSFQSLEVPRTSATRVRT